MHIISGIFVGWIVAKLTNTPKHQIKCVLAACGFGNSTGLPITLLAVVHANFPETSNLGAVDPTLFLSVYLLLYPVLQWGLGGWMLTPERDHAKQESITLDNTSSSLRSNPVTDSLRHNVLNNKAQEGFYKEHRRGLSSADEGLYMTEM
jgi:predicted permease